MSEVNFINKSGIQNKTELELSFAGESDNIDDNKKNAFKSVEPQKNSNRNTLITLFISLFIVLFFIFLFQVYEKNNINPSKDVSASFILKIISQNSLIKLNSIKTDDNKIKLILNCEKNIFYDTINLLKNFNYNVSGSIADERHLIHIVEDWYVNNEMKISIKDMQKYINDFKGIKSDILNDKLIVAGNLNDLISLLDLFEKKNIVRYYNMDISIFSKNGDKEFFKIIFK